MGTKLAAGLLRVLDDYSRASAETFEKHPLAAFMRGELRNQLRNVVEEPIRYRCKGSAGDGRWAMVPWLAAFDVLVTTSAQSGYYPVFLFRRDMTGVYLALIQGVTEINEKYKGDTIEALKARSHDLRLQLGGVPANFPETHIALRADGNRNARLYEAGTVCAALYERDAMPSEAELAQEVGHMLGLYSYLVYNETVPSGDGAKEATELAGDFIEDLRRRRQHWRIERNATLVKAVKQHHGTRCKACGLSFPDMYGGLGEGFIEAHHLTPLHEIKGTHVRLDPAHDFTVLCANCHAMIHKSGHVGDVSAFVETYLGQIRPWPGTTPFTQKPSR